MKHFTFFALMVVVIGLFSCESGNYPYVSPPGNNNTTPTTPKPVAHFTHITRAPLTACFTNESTDATRYHWDFGDGTTSTVKDPIHKYKKKGVYRVKLRATGPTGSAVSESNVTVENPTRIYFAGVTYEKLSVENEYIKFKLVDDDIFTTTWCHSAYELISSANLPNDFILQEPVLMNGLYEDDYYVINIYYSKNTSGDGTKLAGFKFYTSEIYDGYPEKLSWSENKGNKISCHFTYK